MKGIPWNRLRASLLWTLAPPGRYCPPRQCLPARSTTAPICLLGVLNWKGIPARTMKPSRFTFKYCKPNPTHAAAHINLGTLFYNRQNFEGAETHYRAAVAADPRYALAYFDLGNVLDETGRIPEAVSAYRTAISLAPTYADAHYNLALAYERLQQPRQALLHWQAYIKLDRSGPWSVHARNQITRILDADKLKLVYQRGNEPNLPLGSRRRPVCQTYRLCQSQQQLRTQTGLGLPDPETQDGRTSLTLHPTKYTLAREEDIG